MHNSPPSLEPLCLLESVYKPVCSGRSPGLSGESQMELISWLYGPSIFFVRSENLRSFSNSHHGRNLLSFFRLPNYFIMLRRPFWTQLLSLYMTQWGDWLLPFLSLWLVILHQLPPWQLRTETVQYVMAQWQSISSPEDSKLCLQYHWVEADGHL